MKSNGRLFSSIAYKHNPLPLQRCLVKSGEFLVYFGGGWCVDMVGYVFLWGWGDGGRGLDTVGFLVVLACV